MADFYFSSNGTGAKSKVTALEHWIALPLSTLPGNPTPLAGGPFPLAHLLCREGFQGRRGCQSCPCASTGTQCGALAKLQAAARWPCLSWSPPTQSERHLLLGEGREKFTVMCYRKCLGSVPGCFCLQAIHLNSQRGDRRGTGKGQGLWKAARRH